MMRKLSTKIKKSISAKFLVTFLLLLIIPLLITTQLFVNRLYSVLKNKEQAYITEKISYAKTQVDNIFSEMDHIATSLILDYHVMDILSGSSAIPTYDWFSDYKTLNSLLSLLTSNTNYRYNISVSGHDDKLYYSGAIYNSMIKSRDPIILRIQEGKGKPIIINRISDGFDDNAVITLGRSVYHKGEYLGSILVDVPISDMDTLLNPFENDTTRMYVLEESSRIIYSSQQSEDSPIIPSLQKALEGNLSFVTLKGTKYLLFQMPLKQNGLSVVTLVSSDSVFRESSQVINLFVLIFFFIIAATIIGIFSLPTPLPGIYVHLIRLF